VPKQPEDAARHRECGRLVQKDGGDVSSCAEHLGDWDECPAHRVAQEDAEGEDEGAEAPLLGVRAKF
jgi:hypothetical protein